MRRHTRAMTISSLAGLLALTACTSGATGPTGPTGLTTSPGTSSSPSTARCAVSDKLVPTCGVLWGVATRPQTPTALAQVQHEVGRRFDLVYSYHDIDDPIPSPTETQEAHDGQILHISIAARQYGKPTSAVTYADIAAGRYDAGLRRQAAGVAALGVPVFLTFEQEANQHTKLGPRGTAAQFKAAWRHIHALYAAAGADNAVWVWVMTGAPDNLSRAAQLWPGNDEVDWISWNVYNQSGCGSGTIKPELYASFEDALKPFYDWVHATGPSLGIDPDKPMMISETGSVLYSEDPARTASWYAEIPTALAAYPQIKAVTLWDSKTSDACDYTFQRSPQVLQAVRTAGMSPLLDREGLGGGTASPTSPSR